MAIIFPYLKKFFMALFQHMKRHKIGWAITFILLGLIVAPEIICPILYQKDTGPMVSVADRLHPDKDWTKEGENVHGSDKMNIGFDDTPRNSMWRAWNIPMKVKDVNLSEYAVKAGYTLTSEVKCEDRTPGVISFESQECWVKGTRGDYTVSLNISSYTDEVSRFTLSVWKTSSDLP